MIHFLMRKISMTVPAKVADNDDDDMKMLESWAS